MVKRALALAAFLALAALAQGALKVGVVVSATGPAASLGIPERNTFLLIQEMLDRQGGVAGRKVEFVILDDASDTTQAVRSTRRLVEEGAVVPVALPGEPLRYEAAGAGHHHHFLCRGCGRAFELPGCRLEADLDLPPGFSAEDHEVVVYGRCPDCA